MIALCPQCDSEMVPEEQSYPGHDDITAIIEVCPNCNFQYLAHGEEMKLNEKLKKLREKNEQSKR